MVFQWNWWSGRGTSKPIDNLRALVDFQVGLFVPKEVSSKKLKSDAPKGFKNINARLAQFGIKKTAKWLAIDFLHAITFQQFRPIQEDKPPQTDNFNNPFDQSQKKIIRTEDPEEDGDVVTKGYLENGKFTGSFTEHTGKTVTVVKGLITGVA